MRIILLLTLLSTTAMGCGDDAHSGARDLAVSDGGVPDLAPQCPSKLPSSCAMPMPSWDGGVEPIVTGTCVPCHSASGQAYDYPLDSYANVYKNRDAIKTQLTGCSMPPPNAATLSPSDRQTIVNWLVCGAPQN
jgi:hypothetical protein